MRERGFYIIKNQFFEEIGDVYLKCNKDNARPHYYCFEEKRVKVLWMIPLSSKVKKYRRIIDQKNAQGKPCDILHIVKLDNGKENVFLLQDMFPIMERYIEREYTIAGNPMLLTSERTAGEIEKKARKVVEMLKHGVRFTPTQPDIPQIYKQMTKGGNETVFDISALSIYNNERVTAKDSVQRQSHERLR